MPFVGCALLFALLGSPALAAQTPTVAVTNAWIRLLPGDLPLAGYFELTNGGDEAVTLAGASSPVFRRVELHRSVEHEGQVRMERVSALELPPGETRRFAPGGLHLMLFERQRSLQPGDRVPVTLELRRGERLRLDFEVKSPADL